MLTSGVVGTSTLTITPYASNGTVGTAVTKTVSWSAASSITVSAANSTIYAASAGNTAPSASATTDAAFVASATAGTGTAVAAYLVALKDGNGNAIKADSVTVTVAGPGLLGGVTDSNTSISNGGVRAITKAVDSTRGTASFALYGDGTAGTTTLTFADGTVVLGTKTLTFAGTTAAKLTVVAATNIALAGVSGFTATDSNTSGASTAAAVYVKAADSAGNALTGAPANTITATSSNTAVATVTVGSYNSAAGGTGVGGVNLVISPVSEGSTTITVTSSDGVTSSATVYVTTAVAAKVSVSTDASSYDPGTAVQYIISATDAAGNPVADGTYAAFLSTLPTTTVNVQGFAPTAAVTFAGGKTSYTFYAPLQGGNVSVTAGVLGTASTIASALQSTTVPAATFAVNGDANSSLAVDAANAATDAANAAAEEASNATEAASEALAAVNSLATTVASLIAGIKAQLTALTALVKKLQK